VDLSVSKLAVPGIAMAPTVRADISPVVVSGPTTSTREMPSAAYATNGGTIV
jgi:hypothetical protein